MEKRDENGRPQNLILEGRRRLSVSGVRELLAFDEDKVLMDTDRGALCVSGRELRVEGLNEQGELVVLGQISELRYAERAAALRKKRHRR